MPPAWDGGASSSTSLRENVAVCVRARPLPREEECTIWRLDKGQCSVMPTEQHPALARRGGKSAQANDDDDGSGLSTYDFRFDNLVLGDEQTSALYGENVYPVVRAAMDGYNGTVFAYGQTGSGKTYTMSGTSAEPGVIPCAVNDVFSMIRDSPKREFLLRVSYLEIYNETLRDLLADPQKREKAPRIIEEKGRIVLSGMREEIVTTPSEVMALLERGQAARHVGATDWNTRSSRSHCVFQITIESREQCEDAHREVRVSQLNLIDLAGSERAATEMARRKEGAFINKSLLTLGTVIAKLTETQTGADAHIPYRDSKLTRLLQTSLSGDARVAVICTITLSRSHAAETLSTLKFGRRCKMVVTKAQRHTELNDKALLEKYRQELDTLRTQLASTGQSEPASPLCTPTKRDWAALSEERAAAEQEVAQMHETRRDLREQIDHLTRLILTSRSVAAETPARGVGGASDVFASPARRGPRMSDLPARLAPGAGDSEVMQLRQELAHLRMAHEAERHGQQRRIEALEAEVRHLEEAAQTAHQQNRGAKRELVRLREEHATDEAHREFRELVSTRPSPEPRPCTDTVHYQARIAALERALAEEKAMRDLTSLPERPLALPMQARGGMTPPCVPLRSRSTGGSPRPGDSDHVEALQRQVEQQQAVIASLTKSVLGWETRVKQQASLIAKLAELVSGDTDEGEETLAPPAAQARPRHSGIRPSDVVQGKASVGEAESQRRPVQERPSDVDTQAHAGKVGAMAKALEHPRSAQASDASSPVSGRKSASASPSEAPQDVPPMEPEIHVPRAVRPEPRTATLPARTLPTPPGGPTRTLPMPPSTHNVAALRASLLAPSEPRASRAMPVPPTERKRPAPSPPEVAAALPAVPEPPSKRSAAPDTHTKLRARVSAYAAATEQTAPPRGSPREAVPLKPAQSMMQLSTERRSRDAAILRELNELKSMPRVESSRVMYMPSPLPSELTHTRLSAAAYKTDASAYYI
ncbi:hypothetical protein MCAP1_002882 [Malassezia caprae]|uniref:Kinesin-like protein n=1 Tax=Malassezia caprae TaxID=1381934 RepID=A0AAF0IXM6_9BASI|nr:hypothetical protein MCAP1_002882 [Malassezia caprae]